MTELEKKVLGAVQDDIPITRQPFLELSQKLGLSEKTFLETLKKLIDQGVIRRFGATIRHQKSGFEANAMAAWQVQDMEIDRVGRQMATCRTVSHCYCRVTQPQWPYNLYTMIHAANKDACRQTAAQLADQTGVHDYILLFSCRELKKTSRRYI